jgi:zinc protease
MFALHRHFYLRLLLPGIASLTLLSLLGAAPVPSGPAFAHEQSDLRPAPAARHGTQPNGLRYVVMPNAEPKGRASLRLLVMSGSFQETEEQRGVRAFYHHEAEAPATSVNIKAITSGTFEPGTSIP